MPASGVNGYGSEACLGEVAEGRASGEVVGRALQCVFDEVLGRSRLLNPPLELGVMLSEQLASRHAVRRGEHVAKLLEAQPCRLAAAV